MSSQGLRLASVQKQTLKLKLSQRLLQSIKLMAMPLAELRETIQQESERNPALDIIRQPGEGEAPLEKTALNTEDDLFGNSSDPGWQPSAPGDPDSKQRFLEGAVSREASLHDHLVEQIHLLKLPSPLINLTEKLAWNLNKDGFHLEPPELVAEKAEQPLLPQALEHLQSLDPLGCGCDNWQESLEVQAQKRGDAPEGFSLFLQEALPLWEEKRPDEIRQSLKITKTVWKDWEDYILMLHPFPGRLYSQDSPQYIIPDLEIRRQEEDYVLVLNDEVLPVLQVEPLFEELKKESGTDQEARKFLTRYVQDARFFINSLAQRENTLLKAAHAIIEFQRDFFRGGPRHLKPLTLKDVGEAIGVHEATVSRITTNKYVQTEWGLFELKFFFTNSISGSGSSGSRVSKVAAQEIIRDILKEAPQKKKLSDQNIRELLAKRGINIARRTVAKYRQELDLPASYKR